uniref:Uncharacterized protein n=1 Tax=Cannabis sativa TaxID=3483 RepID=A0A803QJI2_CANSA
MNMQSHTTTTQQATRIKIPHKEVNYEQASERIQTQERGFMGSLPDMERSSIREMSYKYFARVPNDQQYEYFPQVHGDVLNLRNLSNSLHTCHKANTRETTLSSYEMNPQSVNPYRRPTPMRRPYGWPGFEQDPYGRPGCGMSTWPTSIPRESTTLQQESQPIYLALQLTRNDKLATSKGLSGPIASIGWPVSTIWLASISPWQVHG